ncbi:MAG: type II secretion system F family protein [Acidobacteriaceae bacterium]|nr:type II secretion system F family protein [Acidobacteriaceae bacterium]MBV9938648.1 type II secretion system F family protein [Acidobacteriaceae bacterium]
MALLFPVLFIIIFVIVLLCAGFGMSYFRTKQKQQIRTMLRHAQATPAEQRNAQFLKPEEEGNVLAKWLGRFQFMNRLDLILEQAGKNYNGTKLISVSFLAGLAGLVLGWKLKLFATGWSAPGLALLAALMPFLLVLRKRAKAISEFEKQLPDALDFLSRSMRAGHGFSIALDMLAADAPEPLGAAFRRVANEMQLGSSLESALQKLIILYPLVDVRFFVSSVMLQQETGGNLGEILTNLAQIIRERFGIRGKIKAVSAHGRITGLVLVLIPVGVAILLMLGNPRYLLDMLNDPIGKLMVYGALIGQVLGYFAIKKIVNIKV